MDISVDADSVAMLIIYLCIQVSIMYKTSEVKIYRKFMICSLYSFNYCSTNLIFLIDRAKRPQEDLDHGHMVVARSNMQTRVPYLEGEKSINIPRTGTSVSARMLMTQRAILPLACMSQLDQRLIFGCVHVCVFPLHRN